MKLLERKLPGSDLPGETNISNPPLGADHEGRKQFHYLVSSDVHEQETQEEIENTIGTVHLSRPSIKHVFFLLRPLLKPILEQFSKLDQELHDLVKLLTMERVFLDKPYSISANVAYEVNYQGHKFLFLNTTQPLTLNTSGGGTVTAGANVWTPITFPQGTKITAQGVNDSNPVGVTIRACDVPMALYAQLEAGNAAIGTVNFTAGNNVVGINSPLTANGGLGLAEGRFARTVLNLASAARATYTSGPLAVGDLSELAIDFNVTVFTGGTAPTVTFTLSRIGADGILYQLSQIAAISAPGAISYNQGVGASGGSTPGKPFGTQIQVDMVTTGAPTSITFSASIIGK